MTSSDIARQRLHNQRIGDARFERPVQAVSWLGAVQAQDYASAKFAVGLRCFGAAEPDIERAIAERTIIRTWLLRGTLHLVAASDIRWLLGIVGTGMIARTAAIHRKHELDDARFPRIDEAIVETLHGGRQLTRKELFMALEERGISTGELRGNHILYRAALSGRICLGAPRGKQTTYTLLDEWAPKGKSLERDEALGELARRYFTSHGPATLRDFVWWSSLRVSDARAGLAIAGPWLRQENIDGAAYWLPRDGTSPTAPTSAAHLLPAFDEYVVGYTDRGATLDPVYKSRVVTSNGIFNPSIVIDGRIVGTWKRAIRNRAILVTTTPFTSLTEEEGRACVVAAERLEAFLGMPVVLE